MWQLLKDFFKFSSEIGLKLPMAYDQDKPCPSISLLFAQISFYLAAISIIILINRDLKAGTLAAMIFAALYFCFYLLRKLTKAKLNLKDGDIDLENDSKDIK